MNNCISAVSNQSTPNLPTSSYLYGCFAPPGTMHIILAFTKLLNSSGNTNLSGGSSCYHNKSHYKQTTTPTRNPTTKQGCNNETARDNTGRDTWKEWEVADEISSCCFLKLNSKVLRMSWVQHLVSSIMSGSQYRTCNWACVVSRCIVVAFSTQVGQFRSRMRGCGSSQQTYCVGVVVQQVRTNSHYHTNSCHTRIDCVLL